MINLLYAGNDRVFDGLLISAMSAAKVCSEPLSVYILTMDLTEQSALYTPVTEKHRAFIEKTIKEKNPESTVKLIDVGEYYKKVMMNSPNAMTSYTPYTFLRLFADLLPELPEKIIYLDTDTVVRKNLSELQSTDITGYELGAVLDYYGKIFMGRNYFNAGVLLLNLPELRKTRLFERTLELCAEKKIFLPDQTALNRLVKKKLLLPRKYNEQKNYENGAVIQHFAKTILWLPYFHTRNIKPWQTELVKKYLTRSLDGLLFEYTLKKTEFKGENR